MTEEKIKLVVFDLNETLIVENTWLELNMAMGVTPEEDAQFMKWYEEGIISYEDGQRILERIYLARGEGTREKMVEAMKYSYRPGAEEIITYLHNCGYKLALVSGAIDMLVEKVAMELGIEMFAAHNQLSFDLNGKFKEIVCKGDDIDFKVEILKKFCEKSGAALTEAVCVGDAYNDVKLFELCEHGIAIRGSNAEKSAWKVIDDLSEIKDLL